MNINIKIDWNEWNLGEKVIFASACVAVLSLFMPWISTSIYKLNGLSTYYALILFLAFVYPLYYIMTKEVFNQNLALGLAGISSGVCLLWMFNNNLDLGFGPTVNVTGLGMILFFLCTLSLGFGIWKDKKVKETLEQDDI